MYNYQHNEEDAWIDKDRWEVFNEKTSSLKTGKHDWLQSFVGAAESFDF